ncbi:hypothetical protein T492DRAFT_1124526 [Pavlovales sp. CCMP2436]|nr:hypothetical protein T492DRAFT_1124526 [Pavlovales sp. CCMP2436]
MLGVVGGALLVLAALHLVLAVVDFVVRVLGGVLGRALREVEQARDIVMRRGAQEFLLHDVKARGLVLHHAASGMSCCSEDALYGDRSASGREFTTVTYSNLF